MLPRRRPSSAPLAPQRISSSAGGSLTMVSSTSEDAAASRGEPATFAPCRARSSVLARVRFHTVSGNPAFSRFAPIGLPIRPSPINPTAGFTRNLPERIAIGENRRANITLFGDRQNGFSAGTFGAGRKGGQPQALKWRPGSKAFCSKVFRAWVEPCLAQQDPAELVTPLATFESF